MKPTDERLAEFNGRINTWISKQGLVFQLTHGGTGLGGHPPIVGALIRAVLSVLILVLIGVLAYGGFLVKKATSKDLPDEISKGLAEGLKVESVTALGFVRNSSSSSFREIVAEGDEDSFFNSLHGFNVSVPMQLTDGLFSTWDAEKVSINTLKADLKAGALDDPLAAEIWSSLFYERPSFQFRQLEILKTSLSWGYVSPATWGQIKESRLVATRSSGNWELSFTGGSFSQGFLRDFEIQKMVVTLDQEKGIQIKEAQCLTPGGGTFDWSASLVEGGARPTIQCMGQLTDIPIAMFLPKGLLPLVHGRISASMTGTGSTNEENGIAFQLLAQPGETEPIYLTSNIPILRILGQIDRENNYRKVTFNSGSLRIESEKDGLNFSEINLLARDLETSSRLASLTGSFSGRPSTAEDLGDESLILRELTETAPAATVGASPEVSKDFAVEVLRQFADLQFANPQSHFFLLTEDEKGEELSRMRIDEKPRRTFRPPFVLEGQLELSVPRKIFGELAELELPGVVFPPDSSASKEGFAVISIPLRNLSKNTSLDLANQWEETLAN